MIVAKFKNLYQQLSVSNIESISAVYAEEVIFIDPFHHIESLPKLKLYFLDLYQNVEQISFEFGEAIGHNENYCLPWIMNLQHPKLNAGRSFNVEGITYLRCNDSGKIIYHRDYFDAGNLLYERLPIIGSIISWIKRKF